MGEGGNASIAPMGTMGLENNGSLNNDALYAIKLLKYFGEIPVTQNMRLGYPVQ